MVDSRFFFSCARFVLPPGTGGLPLLLVACSGDAWPHLLQQNQAREARNLSRASNGRGAHSRPRSTRPRSIRRAMEGEAGKLPLGSTALRSTHTSVLIDAARTINLPASWRNHCAAWSRSSTRL